MILEIYIYFYNIFSHNNDQNMLNILKKIKLQCCVVLCVKKKIDNKNKQKIKLRYTVLRTLHYFSIALKNSLASRKRFTHFTPHTINLNFLIQDWLRRLNFQHMKWIVSAIVQCNVPTSVFLSALVQNFLHLGLNFNDPWAPFVSHFILVIFTDGVVGHQRH